MQYFLYLYDQTSLFTHLIIIYYNDCCVSREKYMFHNRHINSTPRKSMNGSTPYNVSAEAYGEEVLKKLQLRRIDPDEVKLSSKLIRNN